MNEQDQAAVADDVVRAELEGVMARLRAAGAELGLTPTEVMSCLVFQAQLAQLARLVTDAAAMIVRPSVLRAAARFLYRSLLDIEEAGMRAEAAVGADAAHEAGDRLKRLKRDGGAA